MRMLVVEDELKLASFVRQALEEAGHQVDVAYDGEVGLGMARAGAYDVLILDHMLPGRTGRDICESLRADGNSVPILMVTARDTVQDKVAGLDAGADDYLTKPFSLEELQARLRSLMRRSSHREGRTLQVEDLLLDTETRHGRRGSRTIELTAREYSLLHFMMKHAYEPVTRAMISEEVWGFDFDTNTNVVDVYINYLRNKVDRGADKKLIHTIRNVGYQLG